MGTHSLQAAITFQKDLQQTRITAQRIGDRNQLKLEGPIPSKAHLFQPSVFLLLMQRALASLPETKTLEFEINSSGGSTLELIELHQLLRAHCPIDDCLLVTHIEEECSSACIALFLMGDKRSAAPDAEFGFHALQECNPQTGLCRMIPGMAQKIYIDFGIKSSWLEENFDLFDQKDLEYQSPNQLNDSGLFS